jgi:conjugal transfer/entry exclusion protein
MNTEKKLRKILDKARKDIAKLHAKQKQYDNTSEHLGNLDSRLANMNLNPSYAKYAN